jgi:hypothetical protein
MRIAKATVRLRAGVYVLIGQPGSLIWQEGEGPDWGKWFFDLGRGNGVSEPYETLADATVYALKAL